MADMMEFPKTWEEFENSYGFTDTKEEYTNGSRLIPSFRVEQWLDHIKQPQKWIPCNERLPNANDCPMDCMVTRRSKYVGNYVDMAVAEKNGTWTHEDWKAITIDGNATCISTRDADIIAWMPLPEPYKGGDSE